MSRVVVVRSWERTWEIEPLLYYLRSFDRATAAYTQMFNLTGWPSTVVRAGTSAEGLPIGVQVVAHPWREDVSLALAGCLEHALGPFPAPRL